MRRMMQRWMMVRMINNYWMSIAHSPSWWGAWWMVIIKTNWNCLLNHLKNNLRWETGRGVGSESVGRKIILQWINDKFCWSDNGSNFADLTMHCNGSIINSFKAFADLLLILQWINDKLFCWYGSMINSLLSFCWSFAYLAIDQWFKLLRIWQWIDNKFSVKLLLIFADLTMDQ